MKKLVYTPILFISALLLFVACTKPEGEQLGTNPDDYSESKLSPGEHKSKLEDIAIEFVDKFDPKDIVKDYIFFEGDFYDSYSLLCLLFF